MLGLVRRVWSAWFGETVERVEADAERFRASAAGRRPDGKTVWVLVLTAGALTGQQYWDDAVDWFELTDRLGWPFLFTHLLGFAAGCVFWYTLPAVLAIKLVFRERVRDYGVKLAGWSSGWKIYLVFVAVMVPLVYGMSATEHFQRTYPFYSTWTPADGWVWLLAWELAYAAQFLALEFFFRGFVVHGLKHRFGVYAVFVMTVPYCMIHFRKPLPECAASIVAGVALGFMSLKTRSVWLGAALHVSVAWGMDACSLYRQGVIG
jgi:membrane protease YdiL (CAAX protease family)